MKKQNSNGTLHFKCKQCGKNNSTTISKDSAGKTTIVSACTCKKSKTGAMVGKFILESDNMKKHLETLDALDIIYGFDGDLQWKSYSNDGVSYPHYNKCYVDGCFVTYVVKYMWGTGPNHPEARTHAEIFITGKPGSKCLHDTETNSIAFLDTESAKRACQEHFDSLKVGGKFSDTFTECCSCFK